MNALNTTTNKQQKISILVTSDVHGNILPISYGNNQQLELGLAKVSTLVKRERFNNPNTILIDNGDIIQGTPLSYYYAKYEPDKINPMIRTLNQMNYDAGIIGNHEFNYGMNVLENSIYASNFKWLSANIINEETKEVYFGSPYVIKEFEGGLKVGILGLTTKYIPNWENPEHIKGLEYEDVVASAKKWVNYLLEVEKVHGVIVSYHGGFERSIDTGEETEAITGENQGYQLCMEVKGMDALLTGHQHRAIAANLNGVTVVQPSSLGKSLGKVELTFEENNGVWRVLEKSSKLLSVENVEPDQEIIELIQPYEEKTQEWLDQPIGFVEGNMLIDDHFSLRLKEHPIIEFINRVQIHVSGAEISNTALFDNQSPGFKQQITMRDIVSNYVYPNTLKVIRVTGQDIKDALEQSASYFDTYKGGEIKLNPTFVHPKPQHYNYDMWEGINYKINISKSIGSRIEKITYKGKDLHLDQHYDVVMNNYRAGGGGNYLMFKNKPVVKDIPLDMAELIANYILERKTIKAEVNNNWEVITD